MYLTMCAVTTQPQLRAVGYGALGGTPDGVRAGVVARPCRGHSMISGGAAVDVLAAADGDDDGAIHGDDVNRAFRAAFVGVVAR